MKPKSKKTINLEELFECLTAEDIANGIEMEVKYGEPKWGMRLTKHELNTIIGRNKNEHI